MCRNRKDSKNRGESEQRARVHRLPCLRKRNPKLPVGQWQTILQGVGRTPACLGQIYKHNGDMMAKNHLLMLAATKKLAEAGGCSAHALQDGLPLTHRQLRVTLPETRR